MQNETHQTPIDFSETSATPSDALTIPVQVPANALKLARETQGMSVGDAAFALKVSPRVIDHLEAGRWGELPGRTFTVGILRAYGRLLNLPVDAMVEDIPGASVGLNRIEPVAPKKAKTTSAPRHDGAAKRQTRWMLKSGLIMVLAVVVLAYGVPSAFWSDALQDAQSLYGRVRGVQVSSPPAEAAPPVGSGEQNGTSATPTNVEAQPQTGTGTLELKFSAPAWVEVRDYSGRIIYSQLNATGSTQFITGVAPLDIMIGNAKQVQARWRDEPVKLDKLSGDDVARQVLR